MTRYVPAHPPGLPVGDGWLLTASTSPVRFPYDGSAVADAPLGTEREAAAALDAAVAVAPEVAALPSRTRRDVLLRARDAVAERSGAFGLRAGGLRPDRPGRRGCLRRRQRLAVRTARERVHPLARHTAFRAVERLEVGGVIVNEVPGFRSDTMPYGGVKDSGTGRERPRFAVEELTVTRMAVIRPA